MCMYVLWGDGEKMNLIELQFIAKLTFYAAYVLCVHAKSAAMLMEY